VSLVARQPNTAGWHLVYSSFDSLENHHSDAVVQTWETLSLSSLAEHAQARSTATARWRSLLSHRYAGWDDTLYPRDPRLVYVDDLAFMSGE